LRVQEGFEGVGGEGEDLSWAGCGDDSRG
jgi:hypothetical protein